MNKKGEGLWVGEKEEKEEREKGAFWKRKSSVKRFDLTFVFGTEFKEMETSSQNVLDLIFRSKMHLFSFLSFPFLLAGCANE